jgi:hypothetical protein
MLYFTILYKAGLQRSDPTQMTKRCLDIVKVIYIYGLDWHQFGRVGMNR